MMIYLILVVIAYAGISTCSVVYDMYQDMKNRLGRIHKLLTGI